MDPRVRGPQFRIAIRPFVIQRKGPQPKMALPGEVAYTGTVRGYRRRTQSTAETTGCAECGGGDDQDLIQIFPVTDAADKKTRSTVDFDSNYYYYSSNRRSRSSRARLNRSKQENKLDTNLFESYLEKLWGITSDAEKSFTRLDSLWFSLYKEGLAENPPDQKDKVLKWINERKIFQRNYVFVPIVCWGHWSLLILCNFKKRINARSQNPCMLLLDSLEKANPTRLEPDIRSFIRDIYSINGNQPEKKKILSEIPLLVPKVPQQRNGDECGIFVLYFIYLFMKNAPKMFNIDRYPYFLTENWFSMEDLERFRKDKLLNEASSTSLADDVEQLLKDGCLADVSEELHPIAQWQSIKKVPRKPLKKKISDAIKSLSDVCSMSESGDHSNQGGFTHEPESDVRLKVYYRRRSLKPNQVIGKIRDQLKSC